MYIYLYTMYLVTLWAVCWCTYICIPGDIVSSLLMYIYLYTWWHCEQFVDVHISVYLVTLWAVCWCTYICIPGDIVSSLLMYIYLYTWWHCEQFVDVHISVYLVTLWAVFALISQNYKITLQILKVHFSMNNLSLYIIIELLTIVQIPG